MAAVTAKIKNFISGVIPMSYREEKNKRNWGGLWKKISAIPPGRIFEAALQDILKAYGGDEQIKEKLKCHIESMLYISRKRKRG